MKENDVLVIFKTHLDVGFTDFAAEVRKQYFGHFVRQAIQTAEAFRKNGSPYRYCWTVGAWLIYEYLAQADAVRERELTEAVRRGDITYHALPFTMHSELAGEKLFRAGLDLSAALDCRFARKTIAAKMTDVPGHTRGIIAPLAERGIRFLQIGVNPATPVPDVPPVFRWADSRGNSIIVMYQKNYGEMLDFPQYGICAEINVMGDNLGPHPYETAMAVYRKLARRYPGRTLRCATLDDLAKRILPYEKRLPVITSEIGDTWIHGAGSDPWKVARLKALLRSPVFDGNGESVFSRKLLEVAEHTWGMDEKTFLPDAVPCRGRTLTALKRSSAGRRFAASWQEQRTLLEEAVESLPAGEKAAAKRAVGETVPSKRPSFRAMRGAEQRRRNPFFEFAFSPENGAISFLRFRGNGHILSDGKHRLCAFRSETFTRHQYDRFLKRYLRCDDAWAYQDFGKPFLPYHQDGGVSGIEHCRFHADGNGHYRFRMTPSRQPGTPEMLELEYGFHEDAPVIDITLQWFGKDPARLPHALWLDFRPKISHDAGWYLYKNGEWIDPRKVVRNGGRFLHAIEEQIELRCPETVLRLRSPDAVLAAMGNGTLPDFRNTLPGKNCGISFNLYNNFWGTNFPMWFGDDMKYRFRLTWGNPAPDACKKHRMAL